jgi:hypothetical protein
MAGMPLFKRCQAMAMASIVLFRTVAEAEFAMIHEGGWNAFPPRLPEQAIIYPLLDEQYAISADQMTAEV